MKACVDRVNKYQNKAAFRVITTLLLICSCVFLCACSAGIPTGEYRYENEDLGVSAYFPVEPTVKETTNDSDLYGAYPVADIKGESDQGITEMVIHYSDKYASYFKSLPDDRFKELERAGLYNDSLNFAKENALPSVELEPLSEEDSIEVSNTEKSRIVSMVAPLTFINAETGAEDEIYFYEKKVFTDRVVCCLLGVRATEEEAQRALDSFEFV